MSVLLQVLLSIETVNHVLKLTHFSTGICTGYWYYISIDGVLLQDSFSLVEQYHRYWKYIFLSGGCIITQDISGAETLIIIQINYVSNIQYAEYFQVSTLFVGVVHADSTVMKWAVFEMWIWTFSGSLCFRSDPMKMRGMLKHVGVVSVLIKSLVLKDQLCTMVVFWLHWWLVI